MPMSNEEYLIAVYDIGKTNKKFVLFTDTLKPIYSTSTRIGEITRDGVLCDDVHSIIRWMHKALAEAPRRGEIRSIAVTTFGATGVLLDERGNLAFPVVSYNHDIDPAIRSRFYETFGSPEDLYMRTGTPPYGQLLNFGIQLFWIREAHLKVYKRTRSILFLPQYLSYVLTGVKSIEITSVGCHTYLYDIVEKGWSNVAKGLDVPSRTPEEFTEVWRPIGKAKWAEKALVTTGIHDSNASLLPFLVTGELGNFILASTGTWCVFMHPGPVFRPLREDVYRDVLYYIDAFGRPVRSSRFKGGHEFDHYMSIMRKLFKLGPGIIDMDADKRILTKILREKRAFIVPTLTPGSGQFPKSKGRIIGEEEFRKDLKTAFHLLNLSIAVQTYFAVRAILGEKPVKGMKIIVAGGFAKNTLYLRLLATIFRDSEVLKAGYADLTSLGAAITAKAAYEEISPMQVEKELVRSIIAESPIDPIDIDEALIMEYINDFERHCLSE